MCSEFNRRKRKKVRNQEPEVAQGFRTSEQQINVSVHHLNSSRTQMFEGNEAKGKAQNVREAAKLRAEVRINEKPLLKMNISAFKSLRKSSKYDASTVVGTEMVNWPTGVQ